MSNTQTAEPEVVKPLKGKYDGRGKYPRTAEMMKPGPKPLRIRNLSQNEASRVSKEIDAIASPAQMFKAALEQNDLGLAWRIREDVRNRWLGKPYQAVNPEERAKAANILNDNRLQIAVQQLLPSGKQPKGKRIKAKQLSEPAQLTEFSLSDTKDAK